MSLFDTLSEKDFIAQYWQQKSLVIRQQFTNLHTLIDGNELAGLACEEDVESRIISGHAIDDDWDCRQGPFTEKDFAQLDEKNWTLLVQGVEQWDTDIRKLLDRFSFLPAWRLEDIMASYAPPGGGVGPHFDYYDVFLIQVSGSRQWRIGQQCDESTPLQDNTQVKLLSEFITQETYELNAGDMLYIPAGTAHWGTAISDDCITFSIGFRAPSEKDLIEETLESLVQQLSENNRYQDTSASIDQHPNKINTAAQINVAQLVAKITPEYFQQAINQAFGQLVTDTRYAVVEEDERWQPDMIQALLEQEKSLRIYHYPYSRFAFSTTQLFVNGEVYNAEEHFSQMICDKKVSGSLSAEQINIIVDLLNQGFIALEE